MGTPDLGITSVPKRCATVTADCSGMASTSIHFEKSLTTKMYYFAWSVSSRGPNTSMASLSSYASHCKPVVGLETFSVTFFEM